ncbi:hypothetical protein CHUAL_004319 [Chamberlinius hualienensis]
MQYGRKNSKVGELLSLQRDRLRRSAEIKLQLDSRMCSVAAVNCQRVMPGGLPLSNTDGSLTKNQKGRSMNNPPNSLSEHTSRRIATDNMPVSAAATTFSQVLRMPALQEFHGLPSLTLSSYGNVNEATQGSYFYHDNGYGVSVSTLPCIKEEKSSESNETGDRSHSPVERKPSPDEIKPRLNASSPPKSSSESYNEMEDVKPPVIKMERDVDEPNVAIQSGLIGNNYHPRHSTLTTSTDKIVNNNATNIMLVRSQMISNNHHQPIIRYPPNGDALLSASAVGYADNEMLPESGFNMAVSNSLGSLLNITSTVNGSGSGAYDLFDSEGRNEPYSQDLQLSPAQFSNSAETYGLNENSNHEQIIEDNGGNEDLSLMKTNDSEESKLNIQNPNMSVNKVKNKIKGVKSGSPNRTGTLPCPVCSKIFSNSSALAKHKLTHSDERKYVCQLCTKAFKRQDHLNGHLLTHMNKKPYECKVEGCGKSYCDARSLRRHTENHHAAMAQANAAAAAAAAVNAIAIRMGTSNPENESSSNSFLATALQSNRIRYAPPPTTVTGAAAARSSPTLPSSAFASEGGGVTSAATQLQLLAFQQSAAANQDSSSTASTTASAWHQQQNVLFINSSIGRVNYGSENQPDLKVEKESNETAGGSLGTQNEGGERIPSVLERHLKMGINSSKDLPRQGLHTLPTSTPTIPIMAFQLKNQWSQPSNFNSSLDFGSDPKPVECNICQRRFKNIPALNGHMRLHGGYLKRDTDSLKKSQEKKLDANQLVHNPSSTNSSHSPLQTASINVRALIEEKIIQKRITNPPLLPINSNPQPPLPPPLFLPEPPRMSSSVNSLPHSIDHPPSLEHHRPIDSSFMTFPEIMNTENVGEGLLYENSEHSVLPSPNLPPPALPSRLSQTAQSNESRLIQGDGNIIEEDAQTTMQRQIEIIKQGLMSHQPPLEKFRRHSDSDHFLAPDRSSFMELYDPSSSSSFIDYMRQRMVSKRTQRTGSDPGEFAVGEQLNDDMFSGDLEIEDLAAGDDVTGGIPSSDMMDFEMVDTNNDHSSKNNTTSLLAAALCSTPPSTLMDVIEGIASPFNDNLDMPDSAGPGQSENSFKNIDVGEDDDVFISPSSIPNSPSIMKRKHRPEPLHIPPQVSTGVYQSRLRSPRLWDPSFGKVMSPPPYTPPPMLSPVRSGPGLFWHVLSGSGSLTPKSAPVTPGRFSNCYTSASVTIDTIPVVAEETTDSEPPETDIQPHVNIGASFQANLPSFRTGQTNYEPYMADLVWDPKTEEMLTEKDVDLYLQFACCAAIPGGGRNKEYALHVLHMTNGNIQEAMLKLMEPLPRLPKKHPLYSYCYAENDKWMPEEIESYQQALSVCDKDFQKIAQELNTKTVQQCVQFYYLWKKICPEEYKRLRTIRRKREMDNSYNLRSKPYGTDDFEQSQTPKSDDRGSSPGQPGEIVVERFVCDYPDCFASFASRQALNGHIRIHGGNPTLGRIGGHHSKGNDDLNAQPYSPSTNSVSNASTHYAETVEDFPCKICGKVFLKVKSRNAHMKSHRPIDSDRLK